MTGARARSRDTSRAAVRSHPASAQAVSTRGAKPVSQCLKFGRKALRQNGRTATEARVRSSSEVSVFQADLERWSGNRTRDTMITSHLLYPTELSFVGQETGIEPMPSGFRPDALHELHPAFAFIRRNTKPETGSRQPGSQRARTRGLAKERANKVCAERWQEHRSKIFVACRAL